MRTDLTNFRPLNRDILIKLKDRAKIEGYVIYIPESGEENKTQFFTVVKISDKVTEVKVGDTIVMPWQRITDPIEATVDGCDAQYGITSVDEIWAIIED